MTPEKDDTAIIKIEGLKKSFDEKTVLSDINLTLDRGENLVILGKSGTGKSVLIKCIVRLIEPDSGSLQVLGREVTTLDSEALMTYRRKIGFLFQGGALYDSMTLRENLLFPLKHAGAELSKSEMEDKAVDMLKSVNLEKALDLEPKAISGGMKKRAALARTLMLDPDIVLYDEPTTGLDTATSKEIGELIVKMQENYNVSSIIITHDMNCTKITSNRIVMLSDGQIAEEGNFESLSSKEDPWIRGFFA